MSNPIHAVSVWSLPESGLFPLRWSWRFTVGDINYHLRRKRLNKGWVLRFRKGGEKVTVRSRSTSFEPTFISVNGYQWELRGMYGASWGPPGHLPTSPPRTFLPSQVVSVVNAAIDDMANALKPIIEARRERNFRKWDARRQAIRSREERARSRRSQRFSAAMSRLK